MIPLEKHPARRNPSSFKSGLIESERSQTSLKYLARFAAILLGMAAILCSPADTRVLAKTGQAADAKPTTNIDPDAIDALNKMGIYLRSSKPSRSTRSLQMMMFSTMEK
jgi:hypothetical protein